MRRRIVTALIAVLAGGSALFGADDTRWDLRSANPNLNGNGIAHFSRGVVARWGDHLVVADAARVAVDGDELYASGHVLYRRSGLRLTAARLGLRPQVKVGQAWEVESDVVFQGRMVHLSAATVELTPDALIFRQVNVNGGHGGIIAFRAPRVVVHLREPPPGQENDESARIKGVEMIGPSAHLVGAPIFWLPWMYRDFRRGYPWTRVRFGHSGRLGSWGRFWTGSDLPEVSGWRTGIDGRVDAHSRAGRGGGVRGYWAHDTWGKGKAEWYGLATETVRGGELDKEALDERKASTFDASHQIDLGAGALSGRWMKVPDGDTRVPNPTDNAEIPPDLRFLADYMPEELATRPIPRRSAVGVYSNRHVAFAVDIERRVHPYIDTTERWHGEQMVVAPIQLVGPVHLGADAWAEDLHRIYHDTNANRFRFDGYAAAGHWFSSGIGLEGSTGIRGLDYHRGQLVGVSQEDAARRVNYANGYVKLRLEDTYGEIRHNIIPRVGIQVISEGVGDLLPDYGFLDAREKLEEDKRFGVLGVDTALVAGRTLFHADATSRWALRDEERFYTNEFGDTLFGPSRLVDVTIHADGSPISWWSLTLDAVYDGRPRAWDSFNGTTWINALPWLSFTETTTFVKNPYSWTNAPGFGLIANRYRLDTTLSLRPEGAAIDAWSWKLLRRMVDGDLTLGFELVRDVDGVLFDRRVSLGFTILGGGTNESLSNYGAQNQSTGQVNLGIPTR